MRYTELAFPARQLDIGPLFWDDDENASLCRASEPLGSDCHVQVAIARQTSAFPVVYSDPVRYHRCVAISLYFVLLLFAIEFPSKNMSMKNECFLSCSVISRKKYAPGVREKNCAPTLKGYRNVALFSCTILYSFLQLNLLLTKTNCDIYMDHIDESVLARC